MEERGVYYPPCPGAFVGADVACAVLASGMTNAEDTSMLIDLGTNGEIALWHNHTLHCCATAAGPAFEGGGISCGSASVEGAIDRVAYANGALSVHAIGGRRRPLGVRLRPDRRGCGAACARQHR